MKNEIAFSSNEQFEFLFLLNLSIQLIVKLYASPSDNLISLSYSMPVFSANLFGLFLLLTRKVDLHIFSFISLVENSVGLNPVCEFKLQDF